MYTHTCSVFISIIIIIIVIFIIISSSSIISFLLLIIITRGPRDRAHGGGGRLVDRQPAAHRPGPVEGL